LLVDKINAHPEATWKAGFNDRFAHHTVKHLKKMCGTIMTPVKKLEPSISTIRFNHKNLKLPKEFDAREAWSHCPTIGSILGVSRMSMIFLYTCGFVSCFCLL
jgi:cathepsin B